MYNVVILGDAHFDAEPASVYHAHYDEKTEWLNRVQRAEFARNGAMWRERCPRLLQRAAALIDGRTAFALQLGDLIQGDCMNAGVHWKMLDDVMNRFKSKLNGLPFVTVVGNHDIRGYDENGSYGARVYSEYMTRRMTGELGGDYRKTTFSFRRGGDVWIVIDFNDPDDAEIEKLLVESEDARHTFIVTHGPVLPYDGGDCRWFLHGRNNERDTAARRRLRPLFARRNAIVLCGHTHAFTLKDWFGDGGRITEVTMNSVWSEEELQTMKIVAEGPAAYGTRDRLRKLDNGSAPADADDLFAEYRPGLRRYDDAAAAGSYRLLVSDEDVTVEFYGGDAREVGCRWKVR